LIIAAFFITAVDIISIMAFLRYTALKI